MGRSVSVRELRNGISELLRVVEAGERLTVTVDRRAVAELAPLDRLRPVSLREALDRVTRAPADRTMLDDVRRVVPDTTDDV